MSRSLSSLKDIYRDEITRNPMDTGIIPYPHSTEKPMRGMSFELRSVTHLNPIDAAIITLHSQRYQLFLSRDAKDITSIEGRLAEDSSRATYRYCGR